MIAFTLKVVPFSMNTPVLESLPLLEYFLKSACVKVSSAVHDSTWNPSKMLKCRPFNLIFTIKNIQSHRTKCDVWGRGVKHCNWILPRNALLWCNIQIVVYPKFLVFFDEYPLDAISTMNLLFEEEISYAQYLSYKKTW